MLILSLNAMKEIVGKNIIVTGGAGFIGSNLVEELTKNNQVTVIDNFSNGNSLENLTLNNLTIINADVRNQKRMIELCKNQDYIFHLAVQCVRVSLYDRNIVHDVNATGTLNMCEAALQNNVEKFVYVSSSEAYGSAIKAPMNEEHPLLPETVYGASKAAGELYTQAYFRTHGVPVVIVRPFNTYGEREHFEGPYGEVIPKIAIRILNNVQPLIFGDGTQTRDFTYVKDTVKGIIAAATSKKIIGDVVNIAHGKEVSINEIAKTLLEELNSDLEPKYLEQRPGDVYRHYADVNKAKNLLNYEAKTDIRQGIKKYLGWLLDWSKDKDLSTLLKQEGGINWKNEKA